MRIQYWLIGCFVMIIIGCGTVVRREKDSGVEICQTRIDEMQQLLQQRDEEIYNLRMELRRKKTDLDARGENLQGSSQSGQAISHKQIQIALRKAGFYNGPIDGKVGKNTRQAIRKFQKDNDLPVDGIVGKKTREKLQKYLK